MDSSVGRVDLAWGMNRWVLVETPLGGVQRQVTTRADLADVLGEAGVPGEEAERLARAFWAERPADAGLESSRRDEALWRATGLPAWAILLLAAAVFGLYVLLRFSFLL